MDDERNREEKKKKQRAAKRRDKQNKRKKNREIETVEVGTKINGILPDNDDEDDNDDEEIKGNVCFLSLATSIVCKQSLFRWFSCFLKPVEKSKLGTLNFKITMRKILVMKKYNRCHISNPLIPQAA